MHEQFILHPSERFFSERKIFNYHLSLALAVMKETEQALKRSSCKSVDAQEMFIKGTKKYFLDNEISELSEPEKKLLTSLFDLFELKHGVGDENKRRLRELKKQPSGKTVVFLGPLAVGKSTIAEALTKSTDATLIVEPLNNPFVAASETTDQNNQLKPIIQSQIFFLLSSLFSNIELRLRSGINISDTSVYNDSLFWANYYYQVGDMTFQEYRTYQQVVNMFESLFIKPDLLVCLQAQNSQQLYKGKLDRGRAMEMEGFSKKQLDLQNKLVADLAVLIQDRWHVNTLFLIVNPLKLNTNNACFESQYSEGKVKKIKQKLGVSS